MPALGLEISSTLDFNFVNKEHSFADQHTVVIEDIVPMRLQIVLITPRFYRGTVVARSAQCE